MPPLVPKALKLFLFVAVVLAIPCAASRGQTWDDKAGGNWGTSNNWSPKTVPNSAGAAVTFGGLKGDSRTVTVNPGNNNSFTVGTISFTTNDNYTLARASGNDGGNGIRFDNNTSNGLISVSGGSGGPHTIDTDLIIAGNGVLEITQDSGNSLTIARAISGSGSLIKNGTGTLVMTGVSSYTGDTWIQNGTLALVTGANDDNRLPTSTILRIDAPGIFDMRDSTQTLGGLRGSGGVVNATAVGGLAEVLTLNVTTSTPLVFDGVIGNGGDGVSLVKSGSGTQVLAGTGSSYTGGTTVTGGTLLFSNTSGSGAGTSAVAVSGSGTTVGGTGSFTGALTLGSGTRLAPGDPVQVNQAGVLNTGAVTMNNGSFFDVDIGGTTAGDGGAGFYDRLVVTGGAAVNGTLTVNLFGSFTPTYGQQFTIVTTTGTRTGTFNGLADGATFTQSGQSWIINYFSNSIVLTAVPEPGSLALIGIALGCTGLAWRRKGRQFVC